MKHPTIGLIAIAETLIEQYFQIAKSIQFIWVCATCRLAQVSELKVDVGAEHHEAWSVGQPRSHRRDQCRRSCICAQSMRPAERGPLGC